MPKLFDLDVSDEVFAANAHLATLPKLPKTDVLKAVDSIQRTALERRFDDLWTRCSGEPDFWQPNYLFDSERDWHIDRYNETYRIGVEIHGGQFMAKSGHSNAKGQQRDWEKLLRCHELGIMLIALTSKMVSAAHVERVVALVTKRRYISISTDES